MAKNICQQCFKNLPTCLISTLKGHIKQERKNLQSTKKQPPSQKIKAAKEEKESKDCTLDYFPFSDTQNVKTNEVMCSMITNDEKSMGYMYLTVIFTHCSASGHEYLLVRYNYEDNAIFVKPL